MKLPESSKTGAPLMLTQNVSPAWFFLPSSRSRKGWRASMIALCAAQSASVMLKELSAQRGLPIRRVGAVLLLPENDVKRYSASCVQCISEDSSVRARKFSSRSRNNSSARSEEHTSELQSQA